MRKQRPDAYNYVILLSDGVANVDATDPFKILERTGDHNTDNPIRLITGGIGVSNYNDYLLELLAQHGNGWYRYLDTTDQAREVVARENWLQLSTPFAAIVGLTADRYGSIDSIIDVGGEQGRAIGQELHTLREALIALHKELPSENTYQEFLTLLDHLIRSTPEQETGAD